MTKFHVHDVENAPEESRDALRAVGDKLGFVPNVLRVMAEAPAAVKAYATVADLFSQTSLSPQEQQVVLLSVAVENRCHYCVAAHTAGLLGAGGEAADANAIRRDDEPGNDRLAALSRFTRRLVRERGWVGGEPLDAFLEAGFEQRHVFEVLVGVTMKTLSNYTNHMAETPLDGPLKKFEWSGPES